MKFGGSSVGDAQRISRVAEIIASQKHRPLVVVVSAMGGITDLLVQITQLIPDENHRAIKDTLSEIVRRHQSTVGEFRFDPDMKHKLGVTMTEQLRQLKRTIASIAETGEVTPDNYDAIVSFGERLSIHLVAAAVRHAGVQSEAIEATRLIVTTDHFTDAEPLLDESAPRVLRVLGDIFAAGTVPIVTGFIGATSEGAITTLGRGASDYTATILGYCLQAKAVWIWTDVTGVMTADPRVIADAQTIDQLSYEEAAELSHFGAKVLHPLTMIPASLKNIPIVIKNSFRPSDEGTVISATSSADGAVKAVTVKDKLTLITVRGRGVSGIPSVVSKMFDPLAAHKIDVYFISHASSEQNVSFIVRSTAGKRAASLVRESLSEEFTSSTIDTIELKDEVAIVAVVGESMQGLSTITGQLFTALGASGVNIIAIAQGSTERNISFVIEEKYAATAVKSLHQTFKLVGRKASWPSLQNLLRRR